MKAQINKSAKNLSVNEFNTNALGGMILVYGFLFGVWLLVQLTA